MAGKRTILILAALVLGGCTFPVRDTVDRAICSQAALSIDMRPGDADESPLVRLDEKSDADATPLEKRLLGPLRRLPYGDSEPIRFPPPKSPRQEIDSAIERQFKSLGVLPSEIQESPGPEGRPLTLSDLQKLALTNSPVLRQAAADVEAAKGAALQARLYPNPTLGFSSTSISSQGGPFAGPYMSSVIKAPGKIKLAFDSANYDSKIAEIKLRRTEFDLLSQVRSGYFEVLVARENLKISRAMVRLTDEVYEVMRSLLKGDQAATYETMQLRVVASQTRALYVAAHNRYLRAWKQLASSMGLPGMPLTEVAGRVDMPIPRYQYDKVLAQLLNTHTDTQTAKMLVEQSRTGLALARITPIPDTNYAINAYADHTAAPFLTGVVFQTGWAVPIFDRNQGRIHQAQGVLLHSTEEAHRVRADLTSRLADAFERYENNRVILDMYRRDMLENQVQAFRAVVARHARGEVGNVNFNDLVTAEQSTVTLITGYIGVLHDMWFAVVDVASLLQTPDLFQVDETYQVPPIPDLDELFHLDCNHPCSPLQEPALRQADGAWPKFNADNDDSGSTPETLPSPRPARGNDSPLIEGSPASPQLRARPPSSGSRPGRLLPPQLDQPLDR